MSGSRYLRFESSGLFRDTFKILGVISKRWRRTSLLDEQLRILKLMNEVTHRMDLNEFARMVGLTTDEATKQIQELAKKGYLRKQGTGYAITEKGKSALKVQTHVPDGLEFKFFTAVGQPTGGVARSLKQFYEAVKTIDAASLEFHLYRKDFENWLQAVLKDEVLVGELENVRLGELKGESLRKRIEWVIETRYDAEALR